MHLLVLGAFRLTESILEKAEKAAVLMHLLVLGAFWLAACSRYTSVIKVLMHLLVPGAF